MRNSNPKPKPSFDETIRSNSFQKYIKYTDDPERKPTKIRATLFKAIFRKEGISVFESDMVEKYGLEKC